MPVGKLIRNGLRITDDRRRAHSHSRTSKCNAEHQHSVVLLALLL